MPEKKLVAISDDDIKTYHDFNSWIIRNCDIESFDESIVGGVIDEICSQIKASGDEGSGEFCFNLRKIGDRV